MQNIDWNAKAAIARKMTNEQLTYAIEDCMECVRVMGTSEMKGKDASYYSDEASIYRQELARRENKATAKQLDAAADILAEIKAGVARSNARVADMHAKGEIDNADGYEVKRFDITEPENKGGAMFVLVETGMVGDEGTLAAIFARETRHIMVTKGGGTRLLNAADKRHSRGLWNCCHRLTER